MNWATVIMSGIAAVLFGGVSAWIGYFISTRLILFKERRTALDENISMVKDFLIEHSRLIGLYSQIHSSYIDGINQGQKNFDALQNESVVAAIDKKATELFMHLEHIRDITLMLEPGDRSVERQMKEDDTFDSWRLSRKVGELVVHAGIELRRQMVNFSDDQFVNSMRKANRWRRKVYNSLDLIKEGK